MEFDAVHGAGEYADIALFTTAAGSKYSVRRRSLAMGLNVLLLWAISAPFAIAEIGYGDHAMVGCNRVFHWTQSCEIYFEHWTGQKNTSRYLSMWRQRYQ